jgi:hypothetical protein
MKISEKCKKDVFAEELPDSSVLSVIIDVIGSHRLSIEYCGWHRRETRFIAAHQEQS